MGTFLFDKIIFGPVNSRRLGISLGINLLPTDVKLCSFDCIYCECGWTPRKYEEKVQLPSRDEVKEKLEEKLAQMSAVNRLPDVITFAGNGEPTLHPEFAGIIDDAMELRNRLTPKARIAVLSNATTLHKKSVFTALLKVEDNIQKLDSAFEETIQILDCPRSGFDLTKTVEQLTDFNGKVIIQTLFVKGTFKDVEVDNSSDMEVSAWIKLLRKIKPAQVMIYTIARDTPLDTLEKVTADKLNEIAEKVKAAGFPVQVSY